jgi:hypothetical protein
MNRCIGMWLVTLALVSCRSYDYQGKLTDQDGLTPPDQFARYGSEQAQAVAIGREYGRAAQGETAEALANQADAAMTYARTLPGVADIKADPLGHRLTVRFKSGWRVGVPPIDDGKRGAETVGVKAAPAAAKP